jgi:hypothetical protein
MRYNQVRAAIVASAGVPGAQKRHLHHVASLLTISQHAIGELHERRCLARHQRIEGALVVTGHRQQQLAIARFGPRSVGGA